MATKRNVDVEDGKQAVPEAVETPAAEAVVEAVASLDAEIVDAEQDLLDLGSLPVPTERGTLTMSAKTLKARTLWDRLLRLVPETDVARRALLARDSDRLPLPVGPFRATIYAGSDKDGDGAYLRLDAGRMALAPRVVEMARALDAGAWPVTPTRIAKDGTIIWFKGMRTPEAVLTAWVHCEQVGQVLARRIAREDALAAARAAAPTAQAA